MIQNQIRKISVGKDYPDGVLHYQVGKRVNLVNEPYTISDIMLDIQQLQLGRKCYNIYIQNKDGKVLWKSIEGLPVVVEYNIQFE